MTEAELQRLAEIVAGLATEPAPAVLSYPALLGTVVTTVIGGVLVNQISDHYRYRIDQERKRRENLRAARIKLY